MNSIVRSIAIACAALGVAGCVMAEKYDAEKKNALNFQRLLAQEEKRTGELDSELKRTRRDAAEHEAKNRELTAQLQAVREQLVKAQEEIEILQEAATKKEERRPKPKPKAAAKAEPPRLEPSGEPAGGNGDLLPPPVSKPEPMPSALPTAPEPGAEARYHAVKPGENLFRIGRKYGVSVEKLRQMNNLSNNDIEIGQRLIVGYE
jgi:LysM repeat protein